MPLHPRQQEFIAALEQSLESGHFVKISLGAYCGAEADLKNISARIITVKREDRLSLTYRYQTRDIVKNFPFAEAVAIIQSAIEGDFRAATLFTTQHNLAYGMRNGKHSLKTTAATHSTPRSTDHDRQKKRLIAAEAGKKYLHHLKITDAQGKVLKTAQDKYRQINKYIEILAPLVKTLTPKERFRIADMGSGKGYLTFALYDYLHNVAGIGVEVTGVEYRPDMVALCNDIAAASGFTGLAFQQGSIAGYDAGDTDILIALHACDTATDDAIAKGIKAGAELIVVAPCCHKQIRRAMEAEKKNNDLGFLLQHGIFLGRQAEMVTDGLRALLLEYHGYTTKVFEFISDAHTPKNVMITAIKNPRATMHDPAIAKQIAVAKDYFGIDRHHLETQLE